MRLRTYPLLLVQVTMLIVCANAQAQSSASPDYGAARERPAGTIVTMPDRAEQDTPPRHSAIGPVDTPPRGMRMSRVITEYGKPLRRHAPVGQPPITRWDYRGYRLYFENDHVLHAVVSGSPAPVAHADELTPAAP